MPAEADQEAPPPNHEVAQADEEAEEAAQREPESEWVLMNDRERAVNFGDWALHKDLSSSARYMVELMEPTGVQRVKRSLPWRAELCVGSVIDIYDAPYHKWYTGKV